MNCSELNIPEYLHTNDRPPDIHFTDNEKLFRRFAQTEQNQPTIKDGKLTHASLSLKEMSVNREKYSREPQDVLYNIKTGEHFLAHGICIFESGKVTALNYTHPALPKVYRLQLVHEPEPCMYPHSVIAILENGIRIREIKPSSIKTALRDDLIEQAEIIVLPQKIKQRETGHDE
jgi:hypothetical protein